MLTLIPLHRIRTRAIRNLPHSNLINITRAPGNIKLFFLMRPIRTDSPVPINQEHALRSNTIKSLEISSWSFSSMPTKTFLLWFFALLLASPFGLGGGGVDTWDCHQ